MANQKLLDGMAEAVAHARGEAVGAREHKISVPDNIDVRAIRQKLDLTQQQFAMQFGFSLSTVRNWEQGTRVPPGSQRVLLKVIDRAPDLVKSVLEAA